LLSFLSSSPLRPRGQSPVAGVEGRPRRGRVRRSEELGDAAARADLGGFGGDAKCRTGDGVGFLLQAVRRVSGAGLVVAAVFGVGIEAWVQGWGVILGCSVWGRRAGQLRNWGFGEMVK